MKTVESSSPYKKRFSAGKDTDGVLAIKRTIESLVLGNKISWDGSGFIDVMAFEDDLYLIKP